MPSRTAHNVAVLNRSSVVSDEAAHRITDVLQKQATNHFSKYWNIDARLRFVPKADLTSWKGAWNLLILDDSDSATALGYHDQTPEGVPVGKVFAATDLKYGAHVSVTASHELLEMLLDPDINLQAYDSDRGYFVAYEACDAVEADEIGYEIDGVLVSDFVLPDFFDPSAKGRAGARFSYRNNVRTPFELAKGGYEILYVPGRGWTQRVAREGNHTSDRPRVGSRRERRMNRECWQRSLDAIPDRALHPDG